MSETIQRIDIQQWVDRTKVDDVTYLQRQVTEIILHAIAMDSYLQKRLYLKGGVLMGLAYDSRRQTSYIDFSSVPATIPDKDTPKEFRELANPALKRVAANPKVSLWGCKKAGNGV